MTINMSYVRFENTLQALKECTNGKEQLLKLSKLSNDTEHDAKKELIRLMTALLASEGIDTF